MTIKLENFKNSGFNFLLFFANGEMIDVDLYPLIGKHVSEESLKSARIDCEWGCLEFHNGIVDIDPKTLYNYAIKHGEYKPMYCPLSLRPSDRSSAGKSRN